MRREEEKQAKLEHKDRRKKTYKPTVAVEKYGACRDEKRTNEMRMKKKVERIFYLLSVGRNGRRK